MFNRENNLNNTAKKNKDIQLEKKKLLQAKFSKFQVTTPPIKPKEKTIKPIPSTDLISRETIINLRKELKSAQDSNKHSKQIIFDLNNTIKINTQSYDSLLLKFNANSQELIQLKIELDTIRNSTSTAKLSELSIENALLKKYNKEFKLRATHFINENNIIKKEQHLNIYKDQITNLTEAIEDYKHQISTYNKRMNDTDTEFIRIQAELQAEIDHLKKVIIDISSDTDLPPIDELLTYMEINLTLVNYREYDKIHYILWKINKLRNEASSHRRRQTKIDYIPQRSLYGYLIKKDDCFYFSSIQGEVFPIDSCKIKLKRDFIEDKPSKVSIKNGYARIESIYEDIDIEQKLGKKGKYYDHNKNSLAQMDKEIEKIKFNHPFKILIVGSRNKEKYVTKLESYGLDVTWHDSYEDHESKLKLRFVDADVVIICTSHVSHGTIWAIDKLDKRVELLERDNSNTLLHRVRYALIRLGILDRKDDDGLVAMAKGKDDALV